MKRIISGLFSCFLLFSCGMFNITDQLNLPGNATPEEVQAEKALAENAPEGMVGVSGGIFMMGENGGNENPLHPVTVSSFYISRFEVTQKEYKDLAGYNPSDFKGENFPVEEVSWLDAARFCNEKNRKEGLPPSYNFLENKNKLPALPEALLDVYLCPIPVLGWFGCFNNGTTDLAGGELLDGSGKITNDITQVKGYRLPTEAEWEFAARGGNRSKTAEVPGTGKLEEVAWFKDNSENKTQEIGTKKPNELGIFDMSGNVSEWCSDWFNYKYYLTSPAVNPYNGTKNELFVIRGGNSGDPPDNLKISNRQGYISTYKNNFFGFRLARTRIMTETERKVESERIAKFETAKKPDADIK
jgi:sulfatase modifying factor 1